MKQVLIKKGQAIVAETPAPTIDDNNILVEVHYSLISPGTEIAGVRMSGQSIFKKLIDNPGKIKKVISLIKKQGAFSTLDTVKTKTNQEISTGYSCSGLVLEVGKNINDIKTGDLVACAGAGKANHAEYVLIPRNLITKIPDKCSMEDASSVTLGSIALQGVRRAGARLGELVAVIGLGLIGQLTVQLLKASGCTVVGFDIDSDRIKLALSQGMDYGCDPKNEDPILFIKNISQDIGVDVTLITADSKDHSIIQQSMEITRKKGKVVIVGAVGLNLMRNPFYKKEIDLLISCSYGPGRYDEVYEEKGVDYPLSYVRWTENRNMEAYLRLIADNKINISKLIESKFSVERGEDAFESLKNKDKRPLAILLCYAHELGSKEDQFRHKPSPIIKINDIKIEGKVNVGIIGCGSFALEMHLPNLKRLNDIFTIYAISGRNGAKAQQIGRQYNVSYITTDYKRILEDPNVHMIIICTRHDIHSKISIEALMAGKAVFVEKPMAVNSFQLEELNNTYRKLMQSPAIDGITPKFMVGFNRRFSPAAVKVKELLQRRQSPAVMLYRVNAGYLPPNHWVQTGEGGGRIIGEACHMFDLFSFWTGSSVKSISVDSISHDKSHISLTDNLAATLKYEDGSICTLIYTSLGSKEYGKEFIEVYSDNTVMTINDFSSLNILGSKDYSWKSNYPEKGHLEELRTFEKYIKGEADQPIPLEEMLHTANISFIINDLVYSRTLSQRREKV